MTDEERYRTTLQGRSIQLLGHRTWDFQPLDTEIEESGGTVFRLCLTHSHAQFHFAIDSRFSVYVFENQWIMIAGNLFEFLDIQLALKRSVERTAFTSRSVLGTFASLADFEKRHTATTATVTRTKSAYDAYNAFFVTETEIFAVSRSYSSRVALFAESYSPKHTV